MEIVSRALSSSTVLMIPWVKTGILTASWQHLLTTYSTADHHGGLQTQEITPEPERSMKLGTKEECKPNRNKRTSKLGVATQICDPSGWKEARSGSSRLFLATQKIQSHTELCETLSQKKKSKQEFRNVRHATWLLGTMRGCTVKGIWKRRKCCVH